MVWKIAWGWWDGSMGKGTCLLDGTQIVEGENGFSQAVPGLHMCAMVHVHSSTTYNLCFKQKIVWFGPMTLKIFQYN